MGWPSWRVLTVLCWAFVFWSGPITPAAEPLHRRIDAAIAAGHDGPWAPRTTDAEFLRRVTLDLHGVIPTADQARAFISDDAADKRSKLIDTLLDDPAFARRMQYVFDVMLLERRQTKLGPAQEWEAYLRESFVADKPLDQLVRVAVRRVGGRV